MTVDRKQELRMIITRGEVLTQQQDDECYALFPPEEYYAIPESLKPSSVPETTVESALEKAVEIFDRFDPVQWLHGQDYVEWCLAGSVLKAALAEQRQTAARTARQGATVRCVTDGAVYPSIAACARAYGVSATMISNHLAARPGYTHVRGQKFERIE